MSSDEYTRSRRGQALARDIAPEQAEAFRRLVFTWREAWRAEMAGRLDEPSENEGTRPRPVISAPRTATERSEATRFAAAVARHEFGRFYWNGRLAGELIRALERRPTGTKVSAKKRSVRKRNRRPEPGAR